MRAMVLHHPSLIEKHPLQLEDVPKLFPKNGELLVKVLACGVCRTDLHIIEGELKAKKLPLIPGHQVVGVVEKAGPNCQFKQDDIVGVAWLRHTCGVCEFCKKNQENLCPKSLYTGYHENGGYSEYAIAQDAFAYLLDTHDDPMHIAPLLCAGIIGFRALKQSGIQPKQTLGIFGFGSSAHLAIQVAKYWGCEVFVATQSVNHQQLAKDMNADFVGDYNTVFPSKVDAAVVFAPAGNIVPKALQSIKNGSVVAIAGICMTPIPKLDYDSTLFHEKKLVSVEANTREDGKEFLKLAKKIPIQTHVQEYPLEKANEALDDLKHHKLKGTAVLNIHV